jgi:hypothetical protein
MQSDTFPEKPGFPGISPITVNFQAFANNAQVLPPMLAPA